MSVDPDEIRSAWADQSLENPRFSPEALTARSRDLDGAVRARNLRELAAAGLVVVGFTAGALLANNPWSQVGCAWIVLATAAIAWTLATRAQPAPPWGADGRTWLAGELRRERDLLRGVWRWYLGPLVPGLLLFYLGPALRADSATELGILAVCVAGSLGFFGWLGHLNERAAAALDRELAAVESL